MLSLILFSIKGIFLLPFIYGISMTIKRNGLVFGILRVYVYMLVGFFILMFITYW